MRCARSIISKNAQYFHAALKYIYIYLYRHTRPHTHKQSHIKGAKDFMVSFVYRGMNVILYPILVHVDKFISRTFCFRSAHISKILNFHTNGSNHYRIYSTTLSTEAKKSSA